MNPQYVSTRPMAPTFGYGPPQGDHGQQNSFQNGSSQPPPMGPGQQQPPQRGPPPAGMYNPPSHISKPGSMMTNYGPPSGAMSPNQGIPGFQSGMGQGTGPNLPPQNSFPAGSMNPAPPMSHGGNQGPFSSAPGLRLPSARPQIPPSGGPQQMVQQMGNMSLTDQQQQQNLRPAFSSGGSLPVGQANPLQNKPPPQQASVPPFVPSQASHAPMPNQHQPMGPHGPSRPQPLSSNYSNYGGGPMNTQPFGSAPPPPQNLGPPPTGVVSPNMMHNTQHGPPQQSHGPPQQTHGPPQQSHGPPQQSHGPPPQQQYETMNGQNGPPGMQSYGMGPTPPPSGPNQFTGASFQGQPGLNSGPVSAPGHMMPPHPPGMQPGPNQGYNRMHPGPMQQQPQQQQQQQQQRRLDPEMMPSPIQVIEDDRKNREGVFFTNERGAVPPLVTTHFVTQDQGNCNPRFIRSSMYTVPNSPDMMKQSSIPFTLTISPFANLIEGEVSPPIVNYGEMGPVRCIRCKAYMCPYMQFIDGGRRFQCNFCRATTDVPAEYFAHLDHTGHRVDKYERPELCLGSYEFVATKDYCKNNVFPQAPAFIFLIDVSYNNVHSGVVNLLCENMKEVLANLPRESNSEESQVKVGFITYNSSVHFYNLNSCLAQPQVMVVPDVQDMFMPLLDGFLVGLQESEHLIDGLMEQIPLMYQDCRDTETILGPAIKAGLEALKAADRSGKLFVFHSSLPIAEAPGKLKNRDDRKLLGTEKEKAILAPQNNFYIQLGQECVAAACSVDLFTFPNVYIDIATIGQICRLTGGQLQKYTYFQVELDGARLIEDLRRSISKQVAFDAIMRVRTSTGIRPTEFFGNYFMSNTTDVELAAIDSDKAICVEIKHDDKLAEDDAVFIQTAILYTSIGGQRRLRVHNLSLNTCAQMADLYRNCELDTIMNYFSKACLRKLCDQSPKQVRDEIITKCATSLACYRKNCANPSSAGQLILPECMKLLPLYANCLLKCDAVSGGADMTIDDRSFAMHALNSMDVATSLNYIYPRLIPVHDLDPNSLGIPTALRCSSEKLRDNGAYLLENGIFLFFWIGMNVDSEWLVNVFGVQSGSQIDIDKMTLLELDNPTSQNIRRIVNQFREERQRCLKLVLVRQRDKLEVVFKHFLVEDKGMDNSPSYVDFLCHVHKEIRNLLS